MSILDFIEEENLDTAWRHNLDLCVAAVENELWEIGEEEVSA